MRNIRLAIHHRDPEAAAVDRLVEQLGNAYLGQVRLGERGVFEIDRPCLA